jgi:hypothetical protein
MRKLIFMIMMIAALLVNLAGAREKLLDSKIKITERDTDKKKILLVADLPETHDAGFLDVELRVSKGGPNIYYSFQFEGVERAFGSINRDTPAERIHLPITANDVQAQMYFWYTSGIGVCEIRVLIYLSDETGPGTVGGGGETEPESRFTPPPGEEDHGPGADGAPGETEPEKVTPPPTKETQPPGKEPEKVTPPPTKETTPSTTTTTEEEKKKKAETTPPPESKETKKTTEPTPPDEPTPPGEDPEAPGSE